MLSLGGSTNEVSPMKNECYFHGPNPSCNVAKKQQTHEQMPTSTHVFTKQGT